jgi:hypothetical protein
MFIYEIEPITPQNRSYLRKGREVLHSADKVRRRIVKVALDRDNKKLWTFWVRICGVLVKVDQSDKDWFIFK